MFFFFYSNQGKEILFPADTYYSFDVLNRKTKKNSGFLQLFEDYIQHITSKH